MSWLWKLCKGRSRSVGGVDLKKLRNKQLTSTEFMQVWFHYDHDKNGYLEYVEFSKFMKDLFLERDCTDITARQVEKYTSEMISLMDTYDEDGDGKFEMSELAKVLKLEENFLENIIAKTTVTDRDTKSVLLHYNSNVNDTIEGPELYAFVGDIARYLGLKLSLSVVQLGVDQVLAMMGTDVINKAAIRLLLTRESVGKLREHFKSEMI
ncbi:hypothetical protein ACHWQZ_G009860 [Mnemiopsis leidyi]